MATKYKPGDKLRLKPMSVCRNLHPHWFSNWRLDFCKFFGQIVEIEGHNGTWGGLRTHRYLIKDSNASYAVDFFEPIEAEELAEVFCGI